MFLETYIGEVNAIVKFPIHAPALPVSSKVYGSSCLLAPPRPSINLQTHQEPQTLPTMGLFNKRNTAAPADTTTATGTPQHREKKGIFASKGQHGGARAWNSRPTFGAWIKATALDIVTMAVLGAIGLGVYFADPAPSRSFPGGSPYSAFLTRRKC